LLYQLIEFVVVAYCIFNYEFFHGIFRHGWLRDNQPLLFLSIIGILLGWAALIVPFIKSFKFLSSSPIYRHMEAVETESPS
jgi:hypothetical protein